MIKASVLVIPVLVLLVQHGPWGSSFLSPGPPSYRPPISRSQSNAFSLDNQDYSSLTL